MNKEFVKYEILSEGKRVFVDAPHAKKPKADEFTGEIAKKVAENLNIPYIVSNVSRDKEADLNRDFNYPLPYQNEARRYYIDVIKKIYEKSEKPLLHIALHGMKDSHGYDFIIGTRHGRICDLETANRFKNLLLEKTKELNLTPVVVVDKLFPGDPSLESLKNEIRENYKIIQLEISRKFRTNPLISELLTKVIFNFI